MKTNRPVTTHKLGIIIFQIIDWNMENTLKKIMEHREVFLEKYIGTREYSDRFVQINDWNIGTSHDITLHLYIGLE